MSSFKNEITQSFPKVTTNSHNTNRHTFVPLSSKGNKSFEKMKHSGTSLSLVNRSKQSGPVISVLDNSLQSKYLRDPDPGELSPYKDAAVIPEEQHTVPVVDDSYASVNNKGFELESPSVQLDYDEMPDTETRDGIKKLLNDGRPS